MPNLNENARQLWDRTTNLMASGEAQASLLKSVDANQDGKVTGAEVKAALDSNRDGYLSSNEVERLALKATAHDFDKTTIKAVAQAVNSSPHIVLFEEQKPTVKPTDPATPTETSPTVPEPLAIWKQSTALEKIKEQHQTSIPYHPGALPSREPDKLTVVKPGLLRVQEQEGNSCGTTSLSMLLKYWQGHNLENNVTTIDQYIRAQGQLEVALPGGIKKFEIDGYTAGRDIVEYAQQHGMRAGLKNNASISDIKAYIDKGVPVMCLTDWNFEGGTREMPAKANPDAKSVHWVNIIGYEYQQNPESKQTELYLKIANPHGIVQRVSESDFKKIWEDIKLKAGNKLINTGMDRLLVAMVPRDDQASIVAPNGTVYQAGDISIPTGNDGIKGWAAQKGSEILQKASEFQDHAVQRGVQMSDEMAAGYDKDGIKGALRNLWNGNQQELGRLKEMAAKASPETRAVILNDLLSKPINRDGIQDVMYTILKDASWGQDFDKILSLIDTRKLAERIESDSKAGRLMSWIAKSEIDQRGQTGPKFAAFATQITQAKRHDAILQFLKDDYTVKEKIVQKVPAALIRDAVKKLTEGITTSGRETAIYELLKATSWSQFDSILGSLNVASLASELESDQQLGKFTAWVVEIGSKTGNWGHLGAILNHLDSAKEYQRADNVLGIALTDAGAKAQLAKVPQFLRQRMIDLMDDRLRFRTPEALAALKHLQGL